MVNSRASRKLSRDVSGLMTGYLSPMFAKNPFPSLKERLIPPGIVIPSGIDSICVPAKSV